ncbi:PLP-dependent aminotransferase family protein [Pseudomonas aeruginosa]
MTNLLLYQRIAQQLAEDIRRGVYQPGERVPSVRKLSTQLNVSHATVLQAYATLEDQGLIRARPQSGFYVHRTPALTAPTPDIARVERPGLVTRSSIINQVLAESRREGVFPLGAAVPHVDYLPVRALHQQLAKVTRFQSPRAFSYMFSPGFEPLRRQVAIRMRDAGVVVDPSQVTITHGCVDAIHMALRVLTRPGDLIATESPSYYGLLQLADVLGLKVIEIPSDPRTGISLEALQLAANQWSDVLGLKVIEIPSDPRTGISLEALQLAANQWSIKALVLTARLSNPFGGTIPEGRQKQLLKLTAEHNIGVVEDDIYGELMFDQGQARSLKSHDRDGRVIYCSSFSKTISPGVRIGWIIAERYQEEIRRLQTFTTHSACTVTQMGVAAYLENGGYDRHLRYIRQEYRKNMTAYQLAVQQYFPEGTQMTRPKGGFILWVSLPAKVNTKELHVRALEQGISIAPGLIFSNTEQFNNCLRLTCGIPWNREAERAIMTLGMLAGQLCQEGLIAA